MKKALFSFIFSLFIAINFTGCGGESGGSGSNDEKKFYEITAVDGYIKNANLKDATGQVATYIGSGGIYRFSEQPTYPLSLTGGVLEDTEESFDINMTAQDGSNVISPITTFLEDDFTLLGKFADLGLGATSMDDFAIDYVDTNNTNIAKLSQLLYMILKDENLTTAFKTRVGISNPTSLNDMFTLAQIDINATMGIKAKNYRMLLEQIKSFAGSTVDFETYLKTYKAIANTDGTTRMILKTGQTISYPNGNSSDRDDGYYQSGTTRSYTDNGNGTVTDNTTGLVWQKEDDDIERNWNDAGTYCSNLTLGESSEWRLPTIEELLQLSDKGRTNPAINPIFTNTNISYYWSSTIYHRENTSAWFVNFLSGYDYPYGKLAPMYVRCVQGNTQSLNNYIRDNSNIVVDTSAAIMWQDSSNTILRTWEDSINYCDNLILGGYSDWRVPSINELYFLVDRNISSPAIDNTFANIEESSYWSSSTVFSDTTKVWIMEFSDLLGISNPTISKDNLIYVRCVRSIN